MQTISKPKVYSTSIQYRASFEKDYSTGRWFPVLIQGSSRVIRSKNLQWNNSAAQDFAAEFLARLEAGRVRMEDF